MNDLEIYNTVIELIDSLSNYASDTRNEDLLNVAIELEGVLGSASELDSAVLYDLSAGLDIASDILFDYFPDIALSLVDTSSQFNDWGGELDRIQADLERIREEDSDDFEELIRQAYEEQKEVEDEINEQVERLNELSDIVEREPTDYSIAEQYGVYIYDSIQEGYTIRNSSASTNIEDAIAYIQGIGIDGIADLYYSEDEELYYVQIREKSV